MDPELKQYLDGKFAEKDTDFNRRFEALANLIQTHAERMDQRFDEMRGRFDTQAVRMDRQGALIQTGSRWTNRMNGWSEKVDAALETKDQEIADVRRRLEKLEGRKGA